MTLYNMKYGVFAVKLVEFFLFGETNGISKL